MQQAHAQPGLECWLEGGSGAVPWRTALEKSAELLGARAIAFGVVGGAGETRLLGIYPSDASAVAPRFAGGFHAHAENKQTGFLRSEIATTTLAAETITIWIVALIDQPNASHLLREVAQAAAHAVMLAARAGASPAKAEDAVNDQSEIRLARAVLHEGAERTLH